MRVPESLLLLRIDLSGLSPTTRQLFSHVDIYYVKDTDTPVRPLVVQALGRISVGSIQTALCVPVEFGVQTAPVDNSVYRFFVMPTRLDPERGTMTKLFSVTRQVRLLLGHRYELTVPLVEGCFDFMSLARMPACVAMSNMCYAPGEVTFSPEIQMNECARFSNGTTDVRVQLNRSCESVSGSVTCNVQHPVNTGLREVSATIDQEGCLLP